MFEAASTLKRVIGATAAISALAVGSTVLAVPAGARADARNPKFCQILSSDQGAGIDFDGLGAAEAKYAAKLVRKLAKTGVPAKLKSDLGKLAKVYDKIAKGKSANTVLAEQQNLIAKALTRMSKYTAENCAARVPST